MQSGPIRSVNQNEVLKVVYENGSEEVFNKVEPKPDYQQNLPLEKPTYENAKYFSLAVGYGNSYGGIGVRAQARLGGILGFGVHAGVGYFPAFGLMDDGDVNLAGSFLASVGVKFFVYKTLYLNAQFGAFGYAEEYYYESYWNGYYYYDGYISGLLYGPSFMIGGDFIWGKHFGFNGALGVSYNINDDFSGDYEIWPALDLGFIYKF